MLVAQDWGNFFEDKDFISHIKKINSGENIPYFDSNFNVWTTDRNLIKLFEVLGYDLNKRNADLFFTNFCLGYRVGNAGGGMTKKLMMQDAEEFKKLCDILEPENILCLGRLTFECVYESLRGEKINIFGGYGDFIEENVFFTANCGKVKTKIFPFVHCGGMGTAYRNLEKQKLDWQTLTYFCEFKNEKIFEKQDWQKISNLSEKHSRTALYGAIIGDIVGSRFEGKGKKIKTKDFDFFAPACRFTDDTVMTVAVANAVLKAVHEKDGRIFRKAVEDSLQSWGRKYPHAGYGKRFKEWIFSVKPTPYNSLGNGSAMRVSAAAWVSNSMFDAREVARVTAHALTITLKA